MHKCSFNFCSHYFIFQNQKHFSNGLNIMSLISYHSCVFLQLLATMQAFIAHSCVVVCFIAFKLHWSFKNVYNAELCCSLHLFNLFCFRLHCHFFAIGVYNSTTFFIRQTLMLLWQFAHIVISFKLTFHVLNSQFFDTFTMFIYWVYIPTWTIFFCKEVYCMLHFLFLMSCWNDH